MHVDLVESLRCPRGHEDGWLVAAADEVIDRRIVRGTVGCPICGGEWRIDAGELSFLSESSRVSEAATFANADQAAEAMRLAALLNLRDASGAVVLIGSAAVFADALASLTGVRVLAVNAPFGVALHHSRLRTTHALPLGVGTVRGVCVDAAHSDDAWLGSAVRAVARGGRVVAPTDVIVPDDVQELARDDREWVGEVRVAASGLVPLRRGGDPMDMPTREG